MVLTADFLPKNAHTKYEKISLDFFKKINFCESQYHATTHKSGKTSKQPIPYKIIKKFARKILTSFAYIQKIWYNVGNRCGGKMPLFNGLFFHPRTHIQTNKRKKGKLT